MMIDNRAIAFVAILILATGCSPSHTTLEKTGGEIEVPQKLVESISFNELYNRVLEPKCIGCHSGSAKINLMSFESVKTHGAKIERAALDSRKMPKQPVQPLDSDQLQILAAWIKAGMPENPLSGEPAPEILKLEPTFASIQAKIFNPRCVACHRSGGEAHQVSLSSPSDMINSPLEVVVPGDPEMSGLMIVIQEGARKKMPPLKSDFGPLTENEIKVIGEWIADGAK